MTNYNPMHHYVRNKVLDLREKEPVLSGAAIGRRLGVTRERVRQILTKHGRRIPKVSLPDKVCPRCKTVFHPRDHNRIYCSIHCARGMRRTVYIQFTCLYCGKHFELPPGEVRRNNSKEHFHSKECFSNYVQSSTTSKQRSCHQCHIRTSRWVGFVEVPWVLCWKCFGERPHKEVV